MAIFRLRNYEAKDFIVGPSPLGGFWTKGLTINLDIPLELDWL